MAVSKYLLTATYDFPQLSTGVGTTDQRKTMSDMLRKEKAYSCHDYSTSQKKRLGLPIDPNYYKAMEIVRERRRKIEEEEKNG